MVVVGPWHVEELAPLKVSADLLDEESITRHVRVLGVPVARRLLDHEVRVAVAQDASDAQFLGEPEAVHKGFVLGDVVGGGEVDLERVAEPVALRGRQYDAGPQAESHLGPVEVHAPMRRVMRRRKVLGLGPVDEEIG